MAARRAGPMPATTPATPASDDRHEQLRARDRDGPDALVGECPGHRDAEPDTEHAAQSCPNDGDHDGLPTDHRPDLAAGHPDGPQQTQLAGPFEHRQRQRVDDAQQRDEHREQQQDGDEAQQLVDARAFRLLIPGLIDHLRVRVLRGEERRDPVLHLLDVRARRSTVTNAVVSMIPGSRF